MKVLVTGADGFIGSHLTEGLVKRGYWVRAFVFYNSFNTWGWLDSLSDEILKNVEIFQGDVRDPNGVEEAMKDMDAVFHLAALIAIPFSYCSPDNYVDTNIKGTLKRIKKATLNIKVQGCKSGRYNVKILPFPGSLSTVISPPCFCAIFFERGSPSPNPSAFLDLSHL